MRFLRSLLDYLLFLTFPVLLGCERIDPDLPVGQNKEDFYWAESEGARNSLQRMSAMAEVNWKTMNTINLNRGLLLSASQSYKGIPYSSTKEINKYVGIDVSFYTFLTAAANPFSVLYTEDIGKLPYHGINCACYYGTVCSASVSYALGFKIAQPSFFLPYLDGIERLDNQDISFFKPCDILQNIIDDDTGHVLMIYKIERDRSGDVSEVILFEAASTFAELRRLSAKELKKRINKDNLVAFRYKYLDKVPPYDFSKQIVVREGGTYLKERPFTLCPNYGDRSVYRYGDVIEIDVLKDSYDYLVLIGSSEEYRFKVQAGKNCFTDLLPGEYKGYLTSSEKNSEEIEFIIANPKVEVSINETVHIGFECDFGEPSYCIICKENGSVKQIYNFTEEDIARGYVDLEKIGGGKWYYKVVFNTAFGTVINYPIQA